MRKNLLFYILFIALFLVETVLFMGYHWDIYGSYRMEDWKEVLVHSLPHDVTIGGYLMIFPFITSLLHNWIKGKWRDSLLRTYYAVCLPLVVSIWVIDVVLYGYWGFRLDYTPFLYFADAPWVCISQAEWWELAAGAVTAPLVVWCAWKLSKSIYPYRDDKVFRLLACTKGKVVRAIFRTFLFLVLSGALVIAIRGGVSVATMNVGRAYFSSEVALNHAAVNPIFSLLYSFTKQEEKSAYYHFMEDSEAERVFNDLMTMKEDSVKLERDTILTTERPNILIVIFESFSGYLCHAINPCADWDIMPTFNRLYEEAVGFENMYCNAWRTDRGVASVLAAYPAIAPYAVMKYQKKCDKLQFISKHLRENGYGLQFIHGGDVNFTNIKGFLTSGGFENIIGDKNFSLSERTSKWGVPDHIVFDRLFQEIVKSDTSKEEPFCKVMLTLSSHEPFDVPFHRLADPFDNSVAYADSCFGDFLSRLRHTDAWDNLLVIAVPDHSNGHAELYAHADPERFRIPMVWTGGVIARPKRIAAVGQQTDIAATLFGQMGIGHEDFIFSKDMLDGRVPHFAFYSFSDGLGFITDSIAYVQDNERDGVPLFGLNDPHGNAKRWGRAYLQHLCNDLSKR